MSLQGIIKNLQEVSGEDVLKKILDKRDISVYWGTATTGKPHIAYFLPIYKIRDFLENGCTVTVLLADIHAFLDNLKAPIEKIRHRSVYYKKIITAMLESIDVDISRIKFVEGSSFQKSNQYFSDILRILKATNVNDAKRAGAEVVKQVGNAKLSSLVYPAMQALDEEYLKVDAQFGGVDQRKIFMYAREFLPSLKYKKRIHLMNPMIPGLNADKMSSSDKSSKIDLLDSKEDVMSKIRSCKVDFSKPEDGLLALFRFIILPWCEIKEQPLEINNCLYNTEKFIENYSKFNEDEIKKIAGEYINKIIEPIRNTMFEDQTVIDNAYDN
ncbi:putative tyrosine--tRNA ligase, cytoplasmic [Nosema granulosis]|uniref:Tyrosine--tRNA ligase n=1 Tax=Nosema granulosis TaxID=83296 RepID=A0A9P6KZP1_9MICR|nr:putative tyrosine--tRNA ligase, cytoplasmic [Nosema granulosis]